VPRNIPWHLEVLLNTLEGAVILAQSVYFQDFIGDAQIIAATPEAARLYGYNHHSELEGKFTSELDHPNDYIALKVMTVIRILDLCSTPVEYDVRIILPDNSIRYVRKNVQQMTFDSNTFWVTTSREIKRCKYKPLPDYRNLLTEEAINHWFQMISVKELEQYVRRYVPERNKIIFSRDLTSDEIFPTIDENLEGSQGETATGGTPILPAPKEVVELELGRTRRLPDNRFIHRCGNCAETWASFVENPARCPRAREDSRGPRCATNRWRIVTNRGRDRALAQARQAGR
jgi:hypothetical protein